MSLFTIGEGGSIATTNSFSHQYFCRHRKPILHYHFYINIHVVDEESFCVNKHFDAKRSTLYIYICIYPFGWVENRKDKIKNKWKEKGRRNGFSPTWFNGNMRGRKMVSTNPYPLELGREQGRKCALN